MDEVEQLADQLDSGGSEPGLTLVFFVPGTIAPDPPWQGVRTGSFHRASQRLEVQIALPRGLQTPIELRRFAAQAVTEAVDAAARNFSKRKIDWDEAAHRAAAAAIAAALTETP